MSLRITCIPGIDSSANQNHQPRDHVNEIEVREVLYQLSAFSKDVLAHLRGMEPGKKWVDFTIHVVSVDDDQTNQAINEDVNNISKLVRHVMPVFSIASTLQEFLPHFVEEFRSENHLDAFDVRYFPILICVNELTIIQEIEYLPELFRMIFCKVCNIRSRMSAN